MATPQRSASPGRLKMPNGRFCSGFNLRQSFLNRCHFDFRSSNHFHWGSGLNNRRFHWSGFLNSSGGAFGLLVSLCFSRGADHGAGNSGGHRQASSQIGSAWAFAVFAGFGFFRTFDHVAVGITLTLTTVAATTLTARTTTWTIAFGVLRTVFRQLFFVGDGDFFFSNGSSGLFGARLTLFTRRARLALFTWLALGALLLPGPQEGVEHAAAQRVTDDDAAGAVHLRARGLRGAAAFRALALGAGVSAASLAASPRSTRPAISPSSRFSIWSEISWPISLLMRRIAS